jgi:hypothetical protein
MRRSSCSSESIHRNGNLYDLALSRLHQLFPGMEKKVTQKVEQANRNERAAAKRAAKAAKTTDESEPAVISNGRCSVRACAYPATRDGKCRSHLADARAEYSLMPSTTSAAISGLSRLIA